MATRRRIRARKVTIWTAVILALNAHQTASFGVARTHRPSFQPYPTTPRTSPIMARVSVVNETMAVDDTALSTFDPLLWNEYQETIRAVADNGKVLSGRKVSKDDKRIALDYLLDNRVILPVANIEDDESRSRQKGDFLQKTKMTDRQYTLVMRALSYIGDYCAKKQLSKPLIVAWHKLQETGMLPRENCFSTYMYVLSLDESSADLSVQVASYHDVFYEPNEKTLTLRIKALITKGNAAGAEELLGSSPKEEEEWKRLRTYVPVLNLYLNQGEMTSALRLYRQMQGLQRVHFEPDTYALLIGALAEHGYFRKNSPPISGATELGFAHSSGPGLLDELVTEMAADVLELNVASARLLYNSFLHGFDSNQDELGDIPLDNSLADPEELVASRVTLNDNTAVCPRTQAKLQLFSLSDEQRRQVHDTLLEMAGNQYEKFVGELEMKFKENMRETQGNAYAMEELSKFSKWLDERDGPPFTAIVDGPNVAYYGHGNMHYSQVKLIVEELERMGEHPLVVMPQKYVAERFHITSGAIQQLDERDLAVINDLKDSGKLYTVASKCLDDYYWMLAGVSDQTTARGETDIHVPISSSGDGARFPGLRPMLITNDQMRDHRWDLLEPRLFRRWCSCHIVNYSFTPYVDNEWEDRQVDLCAADFFSREIQGNASGNGGMAWHFPVSEWDEHDRFCIRVPT